MDNKEIGFKIKKYRKEKGMTQRELGNAIGRVESSIRKYEKGEVEIPVSVLQQIAVVLGIDLSFLMGLGVAEYLDKVQNKKNLFINFIDCLGYGYNYHVFSDVHELSTPNKLYYKLNYDDLENLLNSTESFIKFNIQELVNNREKIEYSDGQLKISELDQLLKDK